MQKKHTLGIICLSPYQGGMELDTIKIAKMLSPFANVHLIAKKDCFIANSKDQYLGFNDIKLYTIDFNTSVSFSIISGVRKIIKEHHINNVLYLGASELKSLYFSFLGLDINLIIRHGTTKSRPKKDWFHRLIYSKVTTHLAICKHLANNITHIIPFGKQTQLKIIYPSLNMLPQKSINFITKPHYPIQLLHVGRIAEGKGQKAAILACKVLHDKGIPFELSLVGAFHNTYKQEFSTFLQAVPYKEQIKLIGHTNNVSKFYENSDIFLFPSDGEGLSNAFIEALVYGLECISFDNTSFPELKDLGYQFHICEDQNILALQNTLLQLTKNYTHQSQNSIMALEMFNASRETQELLQLLH